MKPILRKICRERGQEQNPVRWQENGWAADRCPRCGKPVFSWYDTASHQKCDDCGWTK